jgi:hypothetical protein
MGYKTEAGCWICNEKEISGIINFTPIDVWMSEPSSYCLCKKCFSRLGFHIKKLEEETTDEQTTR